MPSSRASSQSRDLTLVSCLLHWQAGSLLLPTWVSLVAETMKNLPANAGNAGSIPGLGRSPRGGHGRPLQYSCLESPMDRGALQATVHGVSKSQK